MSGIAYSILQNVILNNHEKEATIHKAIGSGLKSKLSIAIYVLGIVLSLYYSGVAIVCYITVAIAWFIPNKQIEKNI